MVSPIILNPNCRWVNILGRSLKNIWLALRPRYVIEVADTDCPYYVYCDIRWGSQAQAYSKAQAESIAKVLAAEHKYVSAFTVKRLTADIPLRTR
ncbi:hypothetical protein VPHK469_0114 [Vibrio phage K469]